MCRSGGNKSNSTELIIAEQNRLRAEEQARNEAAARDAQSRRDAEAAATRERFNRDIETALGTTRDAARGRLSSLGLNPDSYNDRIDRELQMTRLRVPEGSEGVSQFFNTDFVDRILDEDRTARRSSATARVQRELPSSFNSLFDTSADDPFVDEVLGRQRTEAEQALERAKLRGNLTDEGFTRGRGRIDELGAAGRTQAQTITNAIADRFRGRASDIRNRALERAGSVDIFEPDFDLTPFRGELDELSNNFRTGLRGEVEGAIGGQSFFDLGDVLQRAGIAQGAQNPTVTGELSPAALIAERQRRRQEEAQRGVGGGGTF